MIGSSSTAMPRNDFERGPGAGTASEHSGRYAANGDGIRVVRRASGVRNDEWPPARLLRERAPDFANMDTAGASSARWMPRNRLKHSTPASVDRGPYKPALTSSNISCRAASLPIGNEAALQEMFEEVKAGL